MDRWNREDHRRRNRSRDNPSFSSTLLDAIYRSFDEPNGGAGAGGAEGELIFYRETMRKKQQQQDKHHDDEMVDFRRACMIEKWMEKKVTEKVVVRRNSSVADEFDRKSRHHRGLMLLNSSSSSSDSSCGGGFSSSESESFQRPKPIRTSTSVCENPQRNHHSVPKQQKQHENGFVKTKSRALKIYGDLKKVKQPISPGGRLASFLNSLFTAGNTKKPKINHSHSHSHSHNDHPLGSSQRKSKSANGSTCSSASSFSRSCLSKTPSSGGKFSSSGATTTPSTATTKRSVRFCPVSVIVDEDSRPCGHKNLMQQGEEPGLMASTLAAATRSNANQKQKLEYYVMDEDRRRVQEVARDLLKSYQKKSDDFDMRDVDRNDDNAVALESDNDVDEDDEDDVVSCSSSDLFELDNLSAIGIERYSQELPVYETTHYDTNRAIANGFVL